MGIKTSILVMVVLFVSCSRTNYGTIYPTLVDGKYDSEFPYRNCSKQLEEILNSVKKVVTMSEYTTYLFNATDQVTIENLDVETLESKSYKKEISKENKTGSGTIIYSQNKKVVILTCEHSSNFPDTLITYYEPLYSGAEKHIFSLSIKTEQKHYLLGIGTSTEFEILATDKKK